MQRGDAGGRGGVDNVVLASTVGREFPHSGGRGHIIHRLTTGDEPLGQVPSQTAASARRGNRKGVVEKANHSAAQRWWRTLADELSPAQAQASLDRFCVRVGDARARRRADGTRCTVADLAAAEGLRPVPTGPYPALVAVEATVSAQGLVSFRGNRYSVGPGHGGAVVIVSHRLGTATLDLTTLRGVVLARHRRQPDSAGAVMRHDEHVAALERTVLAAFTDRAPCRRKVRRPPSVAARAEAERLRAPTALAAGGEVVVDFSAYTAAAAARGRIPSPDAPSPDATAEGTADGGAR
jgi:hypothetical protein